MRDARYSFLAANVRYTDGRDVEWIPDDTLIRFPGLSVGIIGVATTVTPQTTKSANVRDLRFLEPAPIVDERARALRARGANLVVVVAHIGAFCGRDGASDCRGEIVDLANQTTEKIDAIVSGHTHSFVDAVIRGIPIVQSRSSGRSVAVIDIPLGARTASDTVAARVRDVLPDSLPPEPRAAEIARRALSAVADKVNRSVATIAEPMRRTGEQYALGNLIADAMRWAGKGDVAVMNNGGIRADMQAGPATYGSLYEIQPFANTLYRVRIRGSDLLAYLEKRVARAQPSDHFSGVVVSYSTARPVGSRIESVTVGGRPLDPQAEYSVVMNDFMFTGGDGHDLAKTAISSEPVNVIDLDSLMDYLRSQPQPVRAPAETRLNAVRP
jgi:5'-nucleotidase